MRELFIGLVDEAGLPGELLGPQVRLLYEGATVAHTAGGRPEAVEVARSAAARLLGA